MILIGIRLEQCTFINACAFLQLHNKIKASFDHKSMFSHVILFSPHLREFPVILVLGVATSVEAIHRTLPRAALSQLCIDQFHAQHSTLTLADVINDVST